MMALALTVSAQVQAQEDGGLADLKADMMAAMVHQDSIDTASLMAVYDYECHTQDADGEAVTDRMKLCLLVGRHCTRSFPYRKFRKEREWAEGKKQFAADFLGLKAREYLGLLQRRRAADAQVRVLLHDARGMDKLPRREDDRPRRHSSHFLRDAGEAEEHQVDAQ